MDIRNEYPNIVDYRAKISRLIKEGRLFHLKKGLYETEKHISGYLLASALYGPSYLSFDFALAYHGMIPERVYNYTCATFQKHKTKTFTNQFGLYSYQDVPKDVFYLEVSLVIKENHSYIIASKEKALCDKIYSLAPNKNLRQLEVLLFNDLRIDNEIFSMMNPTIVSQLAKKYRSTNLDLLVKLMQRGNSVSIQ